MALNIFEPRYRLMVRRCMEGSRRLGMAIVTTGSGAPIVTYITCTSTVICDEASYSFINISVLLM